MEEDQTQQKACGVEEQNQPKKGFITKPKRYYKIEGQNHLLK